jgi:DNA sulfur modification protein DndC
MPATPAPTVRRSAFKEFGLPRAVALLTEEIRQLYRADDVPWIIGYSGGKDSTATLQLVWLALNELPLGQRTKTVHVISTDTLVENPVVAAWVQKSLDVMAQKAHAEKMPIQPKRLTPKVEDSYWVNLIGKGYPAPRHKFRWCTERLKIKPSNSFINSVVRASGEAILVLGTRKAESSSRARNMTKHEDGRVRERLSPNSSLPGSLVYTPIEDWSNDDVWMFLMQVQNPWGYSNKDLLGMYAGASADGECPLVVDSSTPSCGDSRFGCWVCTLVEQDKSMTAMIRNDEEMSWMEPLLFLRNATDFRWLQDEQKMETIAEYVGRKLQIWNHASCAPLKELLISRAQKPLEQIALENWEKYLRDFRRMNGSVQIFYNDALHGPYVQGARECWLRLLLGAQIQLRKRSPAGYGAVELITLEELQEIRRIWVVDKHEMEDNLPRIYQEVTGQQYPGPRLDDNLVLGAEEMAELRALCGDDQMHYELTRELLSVERQQRAHARRSGLFERLEKSFGRHFYDDKEDAVVTARRRAAARGQAQNGERQAEASSAVQEQPSSIESATF